jgi:hypothetical protein
MCSRTRSFLGKMNAGGLSYNQPTLFLDCNCFGYY